MLLFILQVGIQLGPHLEFETDEYTAYARNMIVPDSECFQANVRSTYNVVEAACKLGVKKILIASSETTYGVCFAQGDADYHSFPLEEDYDIDPEDTYVQSTSIASRQLKYSPDMLSPRSAERKSLEPSPAASETIFMPFVLAT